MRSSIVVWWVTAAFFFVMSVVYTVWNLLDSFHGYVEWVGTIALLFVAFMATMIAVYLRRTYRAQGGELPADILTADIDDGDPEQGEFSPWSWWPIVLAGAAGVFIVGLAVGHFLLPVGLALFVVAIVGWVYEYYRGHFAR
ncbi:cytochrome c oxidase subunit 4 [Microbacterium soli]|uniref:cytochrome-c oxidase n=1 Tax=Microbacterium soli TaxID=446075 RepID=A0ABP7NF02_9MICO